MSARLRMGSVADQIASQPDSQGLKRCQVQKTVRFIPDVADALSSAARERNVSLNQIVNEAVADKLGVDIGDFLPR